MSTRSTDEVALVRWPEERDDVALLAAASRPRLLVVAPDGDLPDSDDPLEDWVRLPVDDRDLHHRIDVLRRRAHAWQRPMIDGAGRLLYQRRWIALSKIDERLLAVLVAHFGDVVGDEVLLAEGWHDASTENALKIHLYRLRRRLAPLGLEISRLRRSTWVLHTANEA